MVGSQVYGQIPVIKTPQSTNVPTIPTFPNPTNNIPTIPNLSTSNPGNPLEQYEQDRRSIEKRERQTNRILEENNRDSKRIQYNLPSYANLPGTESYRKSAKLINDMLDGKIPINLRDAVFSVENAYFDGKLEYPKYTKAIQDIISKAKVKAKQDGFNWNNPLTRNVMLFRVMSDTLKIKQPSSETTFTSYPMRYDFDDFMGKKEWSKMFVSKLLSTKTGQCHSMPLLYLIMCEATNTEAHLAYSPMHSYIKFKDTAGNWHNLELTNGHIVSDAYIIGSGFISAEALKNKIYMQAQTKKQLIQGCLTDLVMGYVEKYGYDSFTEQNINKILDKDPNFLYAQQIKSNYKTVQFDYVTKQLGRPPIETIKTNYPYAYKLFEERNLIYKHIDDLGYRDMPADAYQNWLKSMDKEYKKQQEQKLIKQIQIR